MLDWLDWLDWLELVGLVDWVGTDWLIGFRWNSDGIQMEFRWIQMDSDGIQLIHKQTAEP